MAITAAQLQTALGDGNLRGPRVLRQFPVAGTEQVWVCSGGTTSPGKRHFCRTTASDNAATQATAVLASLAAGNASQ